MKGAVSTEWYEELDGVMERRSRLVIVLENGLKVDVELLTVLGIPFEENDVFEISVTKVARRVTETKDVPL